MERDEKEKIKTIKKEESKRNWLLVDAEDEILGRLAAKIAPILMGKNKVSWQPNLDKGDYVVVVNASKVAVSGNKEEAKNYYHYSGYPGGLKTETLKSKRASKPQYLIYHAVAGMLPKTKLGREMIKKLFVYPTDKHPHEAQRPVNLKG